MWEILASTHELNPWNSGLRHMSRFYKLFGIPGQTCTTHVKNLPKVSPHQKATWKGTHPKPAWTPQTSRSPRACVVFLFDIFLYLYLPVCAEHSSKRFWDAEARHGAVLLVQLGHHGAALVEMLWWMCSRLPPLIRQVIPDIGLQGKPPRKVCSFWNRPYGGEDSKLALSDTLVFLLKEYFIELNTVNFYFLNKFLNWILSKNC